jgi:integrase
MAARTRSKNTWYRRRAAIKYYILVALNYFLKKSAYSYPYSKNVPYSITMELDVCLQILECLPKECPIPISEVKKKHSKKKDMKHLSAKWRWEIVEAIPEKWRLYALVLAATGCRPDELMKGIIITTENNQIIFKIIGAKVRDGFITQYSTSLLGERVPNKVAYHAGQEERILGYDISAGNIYANAIAKSLVSLKVSGGYLQIKNTSSLRLAVRKTAKKLWPKRRASITPYCFRHAFSSDMKASGKGKADIATSLGHAVTGTQSCYGSFSMSKGGVAPTSISGTTPVKDTTRDFTAIINKKSRSRIPMRPKM